MRALGTMLAAVVLAGCTWMMPGVDAGVATRGLPDGFNIGAETLLDGGRQPPPEPPVCADLQFCE